MTFKMTRLAIALSMGMMAQNTFAADDDDFDLDRAIAKSLQEKFTLEDQPREIGRDSENIIYQEPEFEKQENLFFDLLTNIPNHIQAGDHALALMLINSFLGIENLHPLLSRQAQDMLETVELGISAQNSKPKGEERASQPIPVSSPSHLPEQATQEQEEELFFTLTNKARKDVNPNLPILTKNMLLTQAARKHSQNMAARFTFAHELDGKSVGDRTKTEGYNGQMVGENLYTCDAAYSYSENGIDSSTVRYSSMQKAVDALMDSPGHRENILRPEFNELGVGIATNPLGRKYWTQVFGAK